MLDILYKYTTKGQAQQWQIIAENDYYYTIEGIVGGKLTTSKKTYCSPKNIGKKNETTAEQQAVLEAKAKHQKKLDKGYSTNIETSGAKFIEPMLAEEATEKNIVFDGSTRYFVQPKMDGCLHYNSLVDTEKGLIKIGDIVENNLKVKVKTFNEITKQIELNSVINTMKTNDLNKEWYEIETENGSILYITGNHRIFLPELNCWRRVDELTMKDKLLSI